MASPSAGARFTVSVLDSDFVTIVLGALAAADRSRVDVHTNDISTYVSGDLYDVLTYVRDVTAAAAHGGTHVSVAIALLGESDAEVAPTLTPVGIRARAHWTTTDVAADSEIARQHGVHSGEDASAVRLDGDLANVLEAIAAGWIRDGLGGTWTPTHATIALNSPSTIQDIA